MPTRRHNEICSPAKPITTRDDKEFYPAHRASCRYGTQCAMRTCLTFHVSQVRSIVIQFVSNWPQTRAVAPPVILFIICCNPNSIKNTNFWCSCPKQTALHNSDGYCKSIRFTRKHLHNKKSISSLYKRAERRNNPSVAIAGGLFLQENHIHCTVGENE